MLSGIGPATDLRRLGIKVVADLPVGHGLQDHVPSAINYLSDQESLLTAMSPANLALLESGRGPLTSNVDEGGGHIHTRSGLAGPDIQLHSGPTIFSNEALSTPPQVHGTVIAVSLLNPASRGQVSLRNTAPDTAPRIVHNYLQAPDDRHTLTAGLRAAMTIANQPAMRNVITGRFDVPPTDRDADLLAHARRTAQTQYHPTSTCAIGPVVDNELNVHVVRGLRVVDASVMPTIIRGNTNAPTIMIAERAADLIRGRTPLAPAPAHELALAD
jgi:choline dehydrogenase